jgi:hypothetical protein
MTAITMDDAAAVRGHSTRSPLAVLARYEAIRFARHPLFLICAGLLGYSAYQVHADMYANEDPAPLELSLSPAFLMGLMGLVVAYRLTRSTRRADEAIEGVPADEPTRTAALLLACLVPFSLAVLAMVHLIVAWHVEPMTWGNGWDYFSSAERDAMMVAAALAGLGGPVLGVCLGRWWRWPGATLLVTVVLVAWSVLTLAPWDSRLGNVWHMTSPYVLWITGSDSDPDLGAMGGSPVWRLGYVVALIGLAAVSALLHGATGRTRETLKRWLVGLGIAAVAFLLVASLTGPTLVTL